MFRKPLRRDPLVVGWALVMLAGTLVALDRNTTWSGHLDPHRLAGFLRDALEVFLWSFLLLLFLAWLRAHFWARNGGVVDGRKTAARRSPEGIQPLPWTDRWLRDWREAEAHGHRSAQSPDERAPMTCRHGAPLHGPIPADQPPVLRALSVNHWIVPPGSTVSVTWCFEHCDWVIVDGRGYHPACGEAAVRIDQSRQIQIVGGNRFGTTPVTTATVVAVARSQRDLPLPAFPPAVSLRTEVVASVGSATPIAERLDEFWASRDGRGRAFPIAPAGPPPRLVGVPSSVLERLRGVRGTAEEEQR